MVSYWRILGDGLSFPVLWSLRCNRGLAVEEPFGFRLNRWEQRTVYLIPNTQLTPKTTDEDLFCKGGIHAFSLPSSIGITIRYSVRLPAKKGGLTFVAFG